MKETELHLDGLIVTFEYDKQFSEPEVGYMVDYWYWEVTSVEVASDVLTDAYNIHELLSVNDLARIDEKIENYLNEK